MKNKKNAFNMDKVGKGFEIFLLVVLIVYCISLLVPLIWMLIASFKSFDDVAKALITVTNAAKGTETKIKLVGRNRDGKVTADIPRILGINKQGEAFVADNYIGSKLFFSDYEETQRANYTKAAPTKMADPIMDDAPAAVAEDPFDLESLL